MKRNKVVRITFAGGLLGLLGADARGKFERIVNEHNNEGWCVTQIIGDSPNLIVYVIRLIILTIALGHWTISNGYLVFFEREN